MTLLWLGDIYILESEKQSIMDGANTECQVLHGIPGMSTKWVDVGWNSGMWRLL